MDLAQISDFLTLLEKNNNREWFQKNKAMYQQAMESWQQIVRLLISEISEFDQEIRVLDPKKCIFRIYRDVRFSHNKTPYKTNFSASMKPEGRKSPFGGYYLSYSPEELTVAGGIYQPEPTLLAKIRQEIDYNPGPLLKIINAKKFKTVFGQVDGEKLKRPPKGYSAEDENIELLKHKDFIVYQQLKTNAMDPKKRLKQVGASFQLIQPFNAYFNTVIRD